jgi:hypothetical protein
METGKTCRGIEQIEEKERQRERIRERERQQWQGEKTAWVGARRWRWLILTIGLNQHLRIFGETSINRTINLMKLVNQDLGWFQTFLI